MDEEMPPGHRVAFSLSKKNSDVSGLTRPWLYAFGRADSGTLFSQLYFKNKSEAGIFKTK